MTKGGTNPSCSIIVCTRDRPDALERCLESLTRIEYSQFEVIVVDNAPKNGGIGPLARRWGATYVVEPRVGLSRARNTGAAASRADVVAYLDDDAIADPGWLRALSDEFADPNVMAVAGSVLPLRVETDAEHLGGAVGWEWTGMHSGRRCIDQSVANWATTTLLGGIGAGTNMAFRNAAFSEWPGFDARLGRGAVIGGGEEHHAFFSLVARGFRVVYAPTALVRHPYPETMAQLREKYLADRMTAATYMTMLFIEEPRARRAIVRWLSAAPFRRRAHAEAVRSRRSIVPRWRTLVAVLRGAARYPRSRAATRS